MMLMLWIKTPVWEADYAKIFSWHHDQISHPSSVKQNCAGSTTFYSVLQLAYKGLNVTFLKHALLPERIGNRYDFLLHNFTLGSQK